jgi:release factor glutamine methyltransferase
VTVAKALARATERLEAAGVVGAGHDARILLAEALRVERMRLSLEPDRVLSGPEQAMFDLLINRRLSREPVSRIIGRRLFWDRTFRVTPDVLDPRPETEILIAEALDGPVPDRLLDLGTGSGIIAVTLLGEWPAATALATDLSPAALKVARANAEAHCVAKRIAFVESDWFAAFEGKFGLILSNPPYIAAKELALLAPEVRDHDPAMALTPGGDGFAAYRTITAGAGAHLIPGGRLIVEIGARQGNKVAALFKRAGFAKVRVRQDFDRRDRVVVGTWP